MGEDAHDEGALKDLGDSSPLLDGAAVLKGRDVKSAPWVRTSRSFVFGRSGAEEQVRFLEDLLGVPASSTSVALVEVLGVLGRRRVAAAAIYPEDVTQSFKEFLAAGAASQTCQALKNPGAVPAASGISFDGAVRVGMFLTVEEDGFAAMDEVYETLVSEPYPARKTVYAGLPRA
ncbi:MAG: hypothetical protein H0W36_10090 [Gemmatimonadetes bacterium]|nr:hypothetical protein [Gemmatimonadota bacterium]